METNKRHIIDELKRQQTELPDDAFFDRIKADVLKRVAEESSAPVIKVIPIYRRMWLVGSVAAGLALLLALPFVFREEQPQPSQQAKVTWEDVSRDELLAYIDDNIADFDEDLLVQHLDSIPHWKTTTSVTYYAGRVGKNAAPKKEEKNLFENIEKEDILEYLDEEAIDLEDDFF